MYRTVSDIIEDAVSNGLGLPRSPMQLDILKETIAIYRKCGKTIFDMISWDNGKIPIFDTDSADTTLITSYNTTTGIITFGTDIDIIKAIRAIDPNNTDGNDALVWAQSMVNSAVNGEDVTSGRFTPLDDDSSGNRRIQVRTQDDITTYKIVAMRRFVPAVIDSAYDSANPSATPTDYRVISWTIDHADSALVSYMADELRYWDGQKQRNDWQSLLQVAINKTENRQARDHSISPASPSFSDLDEWN